MRGLLGVILIGGLAWSVGGCAQRNPALTAMPTDDELPPMKQARSGNLQVAVKVEGRQEEPVVPLVPSFKEPELTAEERAALGKDGPIFSPLLFMDAVRSPGSTVGSWYGGTEAYTWGRGGYEAFQDRPALMPHRATGWGGADVGIGSGSAMAGATYPPIRPITETGRDSGVEVGIDRPSTVSTHEERRDK